MRILLHVFLAIVASSLVIAVDEDDETSESNEGRACHWFAKHQSANGMWDAVTYAANCPGNPKCEPGSASPEDPGNIALTSQVALALLGAGYDHLTPSRYKATLSRGIQYLVSHQGPDGMFGTKTWQHTFATTALAEAFGMTNDPALKDSVQKGIHLILAHQNRAHGQAFGWGEVAPSTRNDTWVTAWNVMALKSAYAAGLDVGDGLMGAKRWLEEAWKAANPAWETLDPIVAESQFPAAFDCETGAVGFPAESTGAKSAADMTSGGALCAVLLGHHPGDALLETLANHIMAHQMPTDLACDPYELYWSTIAIFEVHGERWTRWNERVRGLLVKAQRTDDGCFQGSWDPTGVTQRGPQSGRVLSTVYACLSLEMYYRSRVRSSTK